MIWWLVLAATVLILAGVLWLRLHALLVLLAAGLLVAVFTPQDALRRYADAEAARGRMTEQAAETFVTASPPTRLAAAFGSTAGDVGILIAMAGIVGICLLESGAAQGIVNAMLKVSGIRRAPEAMSLSAFILSIPVFFDTVFFLMVPLARSLTRRTGKDYVLYILAIMAGGSIAHSLVPPTPGPLQVAAILDIPVFTMMVAGLAIGSTSSLLTLAAARMLNRWTVVPLRPLGDAAEADTDIPDGDELDAPPAAATSPPLLLSLLPIVLPVLLIGYGTIETVLQLPVPAWFSHVTRLVSDKNVAMGIAAAAGLLLMRYTPPGHDRRGAIPRALAGAGQIILITSAGGALGAMLRQAGIASAVADLTSAVSPSLLLVVVFLVTASIRTLQGSATVSMITAAGVLQGLADVEILPYHPVYVAMAIGAGSKPIAWMTDSGFWVMCKMSGMTDTEGLRTVSALSLAMGLVALGVILVFSTVFPFAQS